MIDNLNEPPHGCCRSLADKGSKVGAAVALAPAPLEINQHSYQPWILCNELHIDIFVNTQLSCMLLQDFLSSHNVGQIDVHCECSAQHPKSGTNQVCQDDQDAAWQDQ